MKKLEAAGVVLVEMPVPELARLIGLTTAQVQLHDVAPSLIRYLAQYDTHVSFEELLGSTSPDIRQLFQSFVPEGSPIHVSEVRVRGRAQRSFAGAARHVSALVRRYRRSSDGLSDDAHRRDANR